MVVVTVVVLNNIGLVTLVSDEFRVRTTLRTIIMTTSITIIDIVIPMAAFVPKLPLRIDAGIDLTSTGALLDSSNRNL